MSVFSPSASPDTDNTGAGADGFTRNAATAASALTLGGLGVASIALTATIAPAQTLMVCGVGGTLAYVGDRQAKGLPVIPGTGDDSKKADAKPATAAA